MLTVRVSWYTAGVTASTLSTLWTVDPTIPTGWRVSWWYTVGATVSSLLTYWVTTLINLLIPPMGAE